MKKIISLIALLLATVILLSACIGRANYPGNTDGSAAGTTAAANKEDTTLSTEGQEENAADLTAIEEFRAIMQSNQWYGRAQSCTFEKPENIDAYFFLLFRCRLQRTGNG